jgi:hypothetical protein
VRPVAERPAPPPGRWELVDRSPELCRHDALRSECCQCTLDAAHEPYVVDSPNFVPPEAAAFAARGYERRGRHEQIGRLADALGPEPTAEDYERAEVDTAGIVHEATNNRGDCAPMCAKCGLLRMRARDHAQERVDAMAATLVAAASSRGGSRPLVSRDVAALRAENARLRATVAACVEHYGPDAEAACEDWCSPDPEVGVGCTCGAAEERELCRKINAAMAEAR